MRLFRNSKRHPETIKINKEEISLTKTAMHKANVKEQAVKEIISLQIMKCIVLIKCDDFYCSYLESSKQKVLNLLKARKGIFL